MQHLVPYVNTVTRRPVSLPPISLDGLQDEFDRYDGLFAELQGQAAVHSGKLAKLMAKLWSGAGQTLRDLFEINRKLTAEKAELAQELDRVKAQAAKANNDYITELDHTRLQMTITRAALREKVTMTPRGV